MNTTEDRKLRRRGWWFRTVFLLACCLAHLPAHGQPTRFATEDSGHEFVHWIELRDAQGQPIDPARPDSPPYSPRATCGKCHDYDMIARGHHFAGAAPRTSDRPGEPFFWVDRRTGTQIPVAWRAWPGTFHPEQLGLGQADAVGAFARHWPGAWPAAPAAAESKRPEDGDSGASAGATGQPHLEIDCLICHAAGRTYNDRVRADAIHRGEYAWAPALAIGLASVGKPAAQEGTSTSRYFADRFRPDGKVFLDIVLRPSDSACLLCHTSRPAHHEDPLHHHQADIHRQAGIGCVDCHGNGLAHHTVRGFPGERHRGGRPVDAFSCRGCHYGGAFDVTASYNTAGGPLGSPVPDHRGMPPVHFEKLTCTACHSGPRLAEEPERLWTSFAHDLGEPGHRHRDDPPIVVAPVFLRSDNGRIAPFRQMWPAYWGQIQGNAIEPYPVATLYRTLRRALRVRRDFREELGKVRLSDAERKAVLGEETAGEDREKWTAEQRAAVERKLREKRNQQWQDKLARALGALAKKYPKTQPVYVTHGQVYQLDDDGKPVARSHPAAAPYAWPLAHPVRPAREALGARGCTECHRNDAPFFAANVVPAGQAPGVQAAAVPMSQLAQIDMTRMRLFNRSFSGRPFFKCLLAGSAILTLLLGTVALGCRCILPSTVLPRAPTVSPMVRLVEGAVLLAALVLAFTAFRGHLLGSRPTGWWLIAHGLTGAALTSLLPVLAIVWCRTRSWSWCGGCALLAGSVVVGTMGLSVAGASTAVMLTLFTWHRWSGLVLILALAMHAVETGCCRGGREDAKR